MLAKGITFSDYEYLVDDNGQRVCAFGWWASVVGVYYTLRGYGLRTMGYVVVPKKVFNYLMFSIINNSNFRYFYEV